jgi:lipoprotein-anchoring transpeptidase ErfK/SrfK
MVQVRTLGRLATLTAIIGWLGSGHPAVADPLSLFEPDHGQSSVFERFIRGEAAAPAPVEEPADATELPAALRRQIVAYPTREAPGTIIIDTTNTHLYFVQGQGRAVRYGIGVGREGFTWSGVESVARKAEWPDWHPPVEMLQRQPYLPRVMAGGPGNPLGARALYLGGTEYRIHGTNQPTSIGHHVSSGCIRMTNDDVIDLYGRVTVGAKVIVMPMERQAAASPARAARTPAPAMRIARSPVN